MIDAFSNALNAISRVMQEGVRTHPDNDWVKLPFEYHASRAAEHLRLLAEGDQQQDHLAHAATRAAT